MNKLRRTFLALGAMILGVGFLGAFPQQAEAGSFGTKTESHLGLASNGMPNTVTCKTWIVSPSKVYPADDTHYWACTSTLNPTLNSTRADLAVDPIASQMNGHPQLWNFLKNAPYDVNYYYFRTRDDARIFFQGKYGLLVAGTLVNGDSRCGNTGTPGNLSTVISMVYDRCEYNTLSSFELNPNVAKTLAHETGHAFDVKYGLIHGGPNHIVPSQSFGFKGLASGIPPLVFPVAYDGDIALLTPCNWHVGTDCTPATTAMTPTAKASLICGTLFKQFLPSNFERSTGVTNDKVCTNSTTIAPNYVGLTPTQIAQSRIPYFINPAPGAGPVYSELFAEEFAKQISNVVASPNFLAMTDTAIASPNSMPCRVISGVYTCPARGKPNTPTGFSCTEWVVRAFVTTAAPPPDNLNPTGTPTPLSLKARECPDLAVASFHHD
ncbi:MAG: hypothetical protein IT342_21235 [Candidatus Melainabacteria bacterium]|nr:hypothetical protein [Candidatus Melainabacteria bacterium]